MRNVKLYNMRIKLDLTIVLFVILFCITSQIELYVLLMIFAIIHELGHLIAGLILGFKAKEIKITPAGMKIEFEPKYEEYNLKINKGNTIAVKRGIIAIAGPLINFFIIFILQIISYINSEILNWNMLVTIIYSNFLIGIFNLIPIYPLDGGRIVKEILHIMLGLQKSYIYSYQISKITIILLTVISSIAILYLQNISIIIILTYLWGIVIKERKRYYAKQHIKSYIERKRIQLKIL